MRGVAHGLQRGPSAQLDRQPNPDCMREPQVRRASPEAGRAGIFSLAVQRCWGTVRRDVALGPAMNWFALSAATLPRSFVAEWGTIPSPRSVHIGLPPISVSPHRQTAAGSPAASPWRGFSCTRFRLHMFNASSRRYVSQEGHGGVRCHAEGLSWKSRACHRTLVYPQRKLRTFGTFHAGLPSIEKSHKASKSTE